MSDANGPQPSSWQSLSNRAYGNCLGVRLWSSCCRRRAASLLVSFTLCGLLHGLPSGTASAFKVKRLLHSAVGSTGSFRLLPGPSRKLTPVSSGRQDPGRMCPYRQSGEGRRYLTGAATRDRLGEDKPIVQAERHHPDLDLFPRHRERLAGVPGDGQATSRLAAGACSARGSSTPRQLHFQSVSAAERVHSRAGVFG